MDIAILSDLHGNYTALRAVLADIERRNVEQSLCLGDVAATGPQPHEYETRLIELDDDTHGSIRDMVGRNYNSI